MGLSFVPAPPVRQEEANRVSEAAAKPALRLASVVSALSRALDLSTGQPVGHSVRSCIIGMRIAEELGLSFQTRTDLFYALLLEDCGCSGNASKTFHALVADDLKAKRDVKTIDWTRVGWESLQYALSHVAVGKPFIERTRALFKLAIIQKTHTREVTKIRCERGYTLARLMGLSESVASGILNLDEHWDGRGEPLGLRRTEIPILSRIMLLAQTLEVFFAAQGESAALSVIRQRIWTWFDPDLVKA
ncbi:MAG: HD-GYP domain-containing protein, partial [Rhodanobacteraceae bacterium]